MRHFTSSVYIVYNNKVLMHKHKKYGIILPVGGHIDSDELPSEAAIREAKEESGLDIELYNSNTFKEENFENSVELNQGEHLNLHSVGPQHEHIDFVFYAKSKNDDLNPDKGESKDFYWFSKNDIEKEVSLKDEAKVYALEALEKLVSD